MGKRLPFPPITMFKRRVFDWVRLREKDESAAFEELRNKVEVFVRAQDALPEEMTGLEFEQYFSGLLVKNGYTNVKVTKKTGDFGADVIADLGGVKYAFQCKYYTAPVGFEAVYQIHAAKTMYGVEKERENLIEAIKKLLETLPRGDLEFILSYITAK